MLSMVTYWLLAWTPSLFVLLNIQPFLYKYLPFIKHPSGFENDFFSQLYVCRVARRLVYIFNSNVKTLERTLKPTAANTRRDPVTIRSNFLV